MKNFVHRKIYRSAPNKPLCAFMGVLRHYTENVNILYIRSINLLASYRHYLYGRYTLHGYMTLMQFCILFL